MNNDQYWTDLDRQVRDITDDVQGAKRLGRAIRVALWVLAALAACVVAFVVLNGHSRPHAPAPRWQVAECINALRSATTGEEPPSCATLTPAQYDKAVLDAKRWKELHG